MAEFLWYHYLIGAVLIVSALIIIVVVMLQQSQQQGLSGVIAGGVDSFFDKNKGRTVEAKLAKITKIVAAVFFVVAVASVILFAFLNK
ncbi:MAG: preprotein translocase subunit SecG [Acutalibacteraceae bacterium]